MNLFKKYAFRKLLSLIFIMLLLTNTSLLLIKIKPASASPGLTLKWTRYLGEYAGTYIGPLAADINGDGKLEIVVTGGTSDPGTDGTVTALDGATGNIIWQVSPGGVGKHTPFEIADINNDGLLEILVFGNYPVALHGNNGSIYWKNTAVSSYNLFGAVLDIDGDRYKEIFVSSGLGPYQGYAYITSLTYDGKIINQTLCWHPCWGGLTIADTNHDGRFELYQGDRSIYYNPVGDPYKYGGWGVRALDAHTLTPLWNDSDILCSSHVPMLADVDRDGILDVIVANQGSTNGGLAVYNATDGSVLTTGGKYRKALHLGLPSHSQPTVADIDGDGNLEIITCRRSNPKIWDLYDWKLDATLPVTCIEPPKVGDVTGDGKLDIIAMTGSDIYIYSYNETSKTYFEADHVTASGNAFTLLQDVDNDGYNELIVTTSGGTVRCFDTPAPAPTPRVRSETQFYSERRLGAAEYVPPPGPEAPVISKVSPKDKAVHVPIDLSELSFTLTDYQGDLMNYTVTTYPDVGSGNGTNVANGRYSVPLNGLEYSTIYTWYISVTDGAHWTNKTFTFTTENPTAWWNPKWQYRRKITINPAKIPSDQTDFPVLIDLTDSSLTDKVQPDGDDFVFADSNQQKLDHQIEIYDNYSGHLVAWVRVPYLSSTTETILYLYYGNPEAENQENPTAVWDTSYKIVLHLNEKTGIHNDSTINNNNGTPHNGVNQGVDGKIDGADSFDGVDDFIEVAHSDSISGFTEAFTASFWLRLEDVNRRQTILNKYNRVNNQRGWFIEFHPTNGLGLFASADGITYHEWHAPFDPTPNVWYYITVVWEANTIPKFYVNGEQIPVSYNLNIISEIYNNVGVPLYIGKSMYASNRELDGFLDEIRVSNPARSLSWILTRYNNERNPLSFYQVGPEENVPKAPVVSNPSPPNGAMGVNLNPTLSITVTDYQGNLMNITFRTNATGIWETLGSYINVSNGTYTQSTTTMDQFNTKYYWSVHVTDGFHWTNQTYTFITRLEPSGWWNADWQYRRIIRIDHTKVDEDQTNFPVVIDLTDSTLSTKAQSDGDDFVFTDSNNKKLNHEIESYDSATGHLIVWVNVPYLSSTTDTILYLYYGNPTCENQENPPAVWDKSHKLVLHLSETHECRFWGMIADSLPYDVVLDHLINMQDSLKALSYYNRDGWGIAYYNSTDITVLRGPNPAYQDPNYDLAVDQMANSNAWIGVAHVRTASSGGIPPWGNPHPFIRYKNGKWWAFGHNGNLDKENLKDLIGPEYLAENPPTFGTNWDDPNVIDSDLYMLYILKCIESNGWNVTLGIAQAVKDITPTDSGAANFFLTDGETLWGFRKGNTLYYYYQATAPQYSVIASQPPDPTQPGWIELSDYNLITLTRDNPPSIITDIRQYYPLLVDSDFNNSVDSEDLRINSASQDWYESRGDVPTLLFLDESDVGGNTGKKAGFIASASGNAYLSQEFSSPQTGVFSVQWDVYVDEILDISGDPDRAGWMLIGSDLDGINGPNSASSERFVYMAFFKDGGGTSGTMDLVARQPGDGWTTFSVIASGLNLKQWYTIRLVVNVTNGTYDVYIDGEFVKTVTAYTALSSVSHISFAQWNDGAGTFYIDNVFAPAQDRYKLTVNIEGSGSVTIDPAESSYAAGTEVNLTAIADPGWIFSMWKGDVSGNNNPITITMDSDKTIIASFTETLLVDSEFNDSVDSDDLRNNSAGQDWYESRGDVPTLLFLDESDVGGNTGKKAGFTASTSGNAYLSQEFSTPQTGVFTVQWDIYVDSILDISNPDRAGWMLIGSDLDGINGPNSASSERFVYMAFFKDGGGTSGTMDLVARQPGDLWGSFTVIATGLNLKEWYTIKLVVNVTDGTYDVYIDGEFIATVTAYVAMANVTHISFAQWNDGAGTFYIDNVFAPAQDRYKLTVNVVGNGSVIVNPGESSYAAGTEVNLTAIADPGWAFSGWSGDLTGTTNPITITMDSDKNITATFTIPQYSLTINVIGNGTVTKNPDKATYTYGELITLTASPDLNWSFLYWSGDLSGDENPTTIVVDGNKTIIARFIQGGACIDSTINGNDGLPYGGLTQGVTGKVNGAYEFDGVDDYIEVPYSATLTGFTEAFTISFWLRLDDVNRRQTILNKYNRVNYQRGWFIEFHPINGLGLFASPDGITYYEWHAPFNPSPSEWYYITIVWESDTLPKFYVDGKQISISYNLYTIPQIYNNVEVPLHIGKSTYAGRYLRGSLDEIRILNSALSASYILTCYNNQRDPLTFYIIGEEETLPAQPLVSDPYPADEATNIPITLTELSFNITDYQGDLMDYYVSTYPDVGGGNATGVGNGRYSIPITGLEYKTTYTWYVNVTDGTHWTNRTFTFSTEIPVTQLLVDSDFNNSTDSADLRANSPGQDWYESRAPWSGSDPTLLYLDESDVGGNTGKKAGFTASTSGNAYLSQEFSYPQTGTFTAQWSIYVDSILDVSPHRAGQMLIGSDLDGQKGPSSTDSERFVFLAFYKPGGGTTGTADLVAMLDFNTQIVVASNLNLDQWYTIKVVVNVTAGTYDIYLDGEYKTTVAAVTALSNVTHISFAQWNDGAGAFYIDNVSAFKEKEYTLQINTVGGGSVQKDPDQAMYTYGTEVTLTAIPDPDWTFAGWSGDLTGTENPITIIMNGDKNITATFTTTANVPPVVSNPQPPDGTTNVPISISQLVFTISDPDGDLMDYYVSTTPDIGNDGQTGVPDGAYSLNISNLAYGTTYEWWVNVTDGTHWTNMSYTFTTESLLLVDSEFNDSVDSDDLRNNSAGQDWYESRNDLPTLLFLDESNVGGDASKKAGFVADTRNAYLTQEFSSPQTGVFTVQWDIYIDSFITPSPSTYPYRAGFMMIGVDTDENGPCRKDAERFVFLAFYKPGGGTTGTMDLVAMSTFSSFTTVASELNLKEWYTIRLVVNVTAGTYDVYVDGVYQATVDACTKLRILTHISFAEFNEGPGAFYVDNVFAPAIDRYKLKVNIEGNGSVDRTPADSSYINDTSVTLTAVPADGWIFSGWNGDLTGTDNPTSLIMDANKNVTAIFTPANTPPEASNLSISPEHPTTTDNLVANYTYYDAEGDSENGTEIRWYRNGILQVNLNDTLTVPSQFTQKGGIWYFTVKPKDGKVFGELVQSPSVTIENTPPTITSYIPENLTPTVNEGESLEFTHTSYDPDNDTLYYTWLLDSAEIAHTQNWTYTPSYEAAGFHNVTFLVSDGQLSDSVQWNVTVININQAPIIDSWDPYPKFVTISENATQIFTITYHDPDNDSLTVKWFVNGSSEATGDTFVFEASFGSAGVYNITVVVTDPSIAIATHKWTLTVHHVNRPPVIETYSPEDLTPEVYEGENLIFNQTSYDPDGDPLSYRWLLDGIDQATTQNWTYSPSYDAAGYHNVTLIVSDGQLSTSMEWNVTVIDVNRPPQIDSYSPTTDPTILEGDTQAFNITYRDPDGDSLQVRWYLNGTLISTEDTYVFSSDYASAGIYNVTVIISDGLAQATHQWILTVTDAGPVLDMPFNEDESPVAVDYSSYGNNGTVHEAIWTTSGNGSYYFDGVSSYIEIADDESLDGAGVWSELTIELWIRISANQNSKRIIAKRYSYQIGFQSSGSANRLYFAVWNNGYYEVEYSTPLSTGVWYHIVCTYEAGVGSRIYINGTEVPVTVTGGAPSGNIRESTSPLEIGRRYDSKTSYFNGLIDDVKIYMKRLPQQQIIELYNKSKDTHFNNPPIIESYSPEEAMLEVNEGETLEFTQVSSDPDYDQLTYSWLLDGIEQSTEQNWTYTIGYDEAGFHNLTLVVSDGKLTVTQYWNVTVMDVNRAPVITDYYPKSNPTISVGDSQLFNITCQDPDGDDIIIQWYLNDTKVGITNSTSYNFTSSSSGTYNVTVVVSDGSAQTSHEWNLTVVAGNAPPVIDSYYPAENPTILEEESQEFNVTYHDPDGDPLAVQWYLNGTPTTTNDSYTFEANYTSAGVYNVTVVISDSTLSTGHEWILTVVDIGPTLLMTLDSDETPVAVDQSGYGNNGTVHGAEWVSDYGGCYFFNASERDYIEIPDDASLDGGGIWTEITIEFWIKPTIDNKGVRLIEKRSAGSSYQIGFQTDPDPGVSGNQLYFNVWASVYKEIVAPFGLETNKWSHVVCTYKDGVGMAIYINGNLAVSASHSGTIRDSTCPINIGRRGDDSSYFTGFMDGIKIYFKALPAQLIHQHYLNSYHNEAPTIDSYYPAVNYPCILEDQSQEFNITYSDIDGDNVTVQWYLNGIETVNTSYYLFNATANSTGTYNVTVVVTDGQAQTRHVWFLTVSATLVMPFETNSTTTVVDYSGFDNNGTVNGAFWTREGRIGGCYSFNGSTYIVIPDASSLDGDGSWTEITIELWFYLSTDQTGTKLIAKMSTLSEAKRSYQIGFQSSGAANRLYGAVIIDGNSYKEVGYNTPLTVGTWYLVTLTYKSGDGLKLYLNGTLVAEITGLTGNIQASPGKDLYIGCRYGSEGFFNGKIDEIRIYPKALNASQIQQHYQSQKAVGSYLANNDNHSTAPLIPFEYLILAILSPATIVGYKRRKLKLKCVLIQQYFPFTSKSPSIGETHSHIA